MAQGLRELSLQNCQGDVPTLVASARQLEGVRYLAIQMACPMLRTALHALCAVMPNLRVLDCSANPTVFDRHMNQADVWVRAYQDVYAALQNNQTIERVAFWEWTPEFASVWPKAPSRFLCFTAFANVPHGSTLPSYRIFFENDKFVREIKVPNDCPQWFLDCLENSKERAARRAHCRNTIGRLWGMLRLRRGEAGLLKPLDRWLIAGPLATAIWRTQFDERWNDIPAPWTDGGGGERMMRRDDFGLGGDFFGHGFNNGNYKTHFFINN